MSQRRCTGSYNWRPFLCPGEAAIRQLQTVHRALPVPDEEHASGFPLHQRSCHHTLRAHAEVKSHLHRIPLSTCAAMPRTRSTLHLHQHRATTKQSVPLCGGSSNITAYYKRNSHLIISHKSCQRKYWSFLHYNGSFSNLKSRSAHVEASTSHLLFKSSISVCSPWLWFFD